jgi:hypothetical protein
MEAPKLTYEERYDRINNNLKIGDDDKKRLLSQLADQEYGSKSFDLGEFEGLLSKLEGSKMRQQRQKSVEGRRDIFSQGMAGMMSNF